MTFRDTVVAYARAQVGKGYRYGAVGPDTFDCSGLTMQAWRQVSLMLPHNAEKQSLFKLADYEVVSAIGGARKLLEPGDIVFYYLPIGHCAIYTGIEKDGLRHVVQAGTPALGVQDIPMFAYATPVAYAYIWHNRK